MSCNTDWYLLIFGEAGVVTGINRGWLLQVLIWELLWWIWKLEWHHGCVVVEVMFLHNKLFIR